MLDRPFINEADGAPVAVCGLCKAEGPVKVVRTKNGNIAVAYLPDGWRFDALQTAAICAECGDET